MYFGDLFLDARPCPVHFEVLHQAHVSENKTDRQIDETQDDDRVEDHPVPVRFGANLPLQKIMVTAAHAVIL
jgi:hypothetical protein